MHSGAINFFNMYTNNSVIVSQISIVFLYREWSQFPRLLIHFIKTTLPPPPPTSQYLKTFKVPWAYSFLILKLLKQVMAKLNHHLSRHCTICERILLLPPNVTEPITRTYALSSSLQRQIELPNRVNKEVSTWSESQNHCDLNTWCKTTSPENWRHTKYPRWE